MRSSKTNSSRELSKAPVRKPSKSAKTRNRKAVEAAAEAMVAEEKKPASFPVFALADAPANPPPAVEESSPAIAWPEPETVSSGDSDVRDHPKRKRRRKKGKGGQGNLSQAPSGNEVPAVPTNVTAAPAPRQSSQSRPKLDAESVDKLAWKIYLAELSEEGVALIGDNDARELSHRCFRLAEIFMEEQARRH